MNDYINNGTAFTETGPLKDYYYYTKASNSKYTLRCIDGRMTGCGKCVGYCQHTTHPGFLTEDNRKEHACIEKRCHYYLPKTKQEKIKKHVDNRSREIIRVASELISRYEGMRIISASKTTNGGWDLKYVSITNEHEMEIIKNTISNEIGEAINMVNLNYSFDRAAQLILAM